MNEIIEEDIKEKMEIHPLEYANWKKSICTKFFIKKIDEYIKELEKTMLNVIKNGDIATKVQYLNNLKGQVYSLEQIKGIITNLLENE